jgi:uncharacterized membrane protein YeaQ/YmgE (transglycosylase-associated protein family)
MLHRNNEAVSFLMPAAFLFPLTCISGVLSPADSFKALGYATKVALQNCGGTLVPGRQGEDIMLVDLIVWLVVGAVAGWLAGLIVKGYGFGLIGNIVVGIVGGLIAGWLLPRLGLFNIGGIVGSIVYAVIGAVILLLIIGLIKR